MVLTWSRAGPFRQRCSLYIADPQGSPTNEILWSCVQNNAFQISLEF